MRRLLLPIVAAFVLVLGMGTYTFAQDASPTPGEEEENPCPEAMATPSASPGEVIEASPVMATEEASPAPEEGCSVEIKDFAFVPAAIQIAVGDTVTWENYDQAPHTVTGDNGEFDSSNLTTDQTFSHTFATAGTFSYHCNIHPNMKGSVVVQ